MNQKYFYARSTYTHGEKYARSVLAFRTKKERERFTSVRPQWNACSRTQIRTKDLDEGYAIGWDARVLGVKVYCGERWQDYREEMAVFKLVDGQ